MGRIKVIILIGGLSISAQGSSSGAVCSDVFEKLTEGNHSLTGRPDHLGHKRWPEYIFRSKRQKIKDALNVVFNTKMNHPEHVDEIMNIWSLSQGRPDLIDLTDVHRLKELFIQSMMKISQTHYSAITVRTLVLILKRYIYKDSEIVFLFMRILNDPAYLQLSNFSNYSHLLIREVVVSALRDYIEYRSSAVSSLGILVEIRYLLEKQLTEMGDFYIHYPSAYKNQSTLLETAVVNIVENVGSLTPLYPSVMESLFKRLALLYDNKSSAHEDSALIEKRRITIRMIRKHLEPDHIFQLARNEDSDLRALVQFFTRDFHSPSPEILEEVEKLLVYQQLHYIREIGISILAGRELAGKSDEPYVSHHFEESVEWLQPPTIAPSRLNPGNMRLIYELSQRDENSSVRQLAQRVVDLTRNREDLKGYVNEVQ